MADGNLSKSGLTVLKFILLRTILLLIVNIKLHICIGVLLRFISDIPQNRNAAVIESVNQSGTKLTGSRPLRQRKLINYVVTDKVSRNPRVLLRRLTAISKPTALHRMKPVRRTL